MATLADILEERKAAIEILQKKVNDANDLKNRGAVGMDNNTIDALMAQQTDLAEQAYEAGLNSPTMAQALAALRAATAEMNSVAARMVSVTTFISNVASLGTATNKAISALKGAR